MMRFCLLWIGTATREQRCGALIGPSLRVARQSGGFQSKSVPAAVVQALPTPKLPGWPPPKTELRILWNSLIQYPNSNGSFAVSRVTNVTAAS
jgi:hypothetical protein